ncbi:MAG: DNA topoisomerase VI subunit B [Thermoplasmata archaeon]|nr:DNA topoisomerase VI subunit B [Thermoplasmata archaeon]
MSLTGLRPAPVGRSGIVQIDGSNFLLIARRVPKTRSMARNATLAEQLASKQREISVAEFFERNRQILGFDNLQRALLTAVKECVDNALDACEEAGVLPDISVDIAKDDSGPDRYRLVVADNGPGILRRELPNVFGRLLYGSRFHANRQSRGQQGIGISAAVLYAGLTTARPAKITSKVEEEEAAHVLEILVDTQRNLPKVVSDELVLWDRLHGTQVELLLKARYVRARQSPLEYLRGTAIVNPHARLVLTEPDGTRITFERASTEVPPVSKEVLPHPYGLELGELSAILKQAREKRLSEALPKHLAGVTPRALKEILVQAGLSGRDDPARIHGTELEALLTALHAVSLLPPSAESLSPIGSILIKRGLRNVLGELRPDFYAPPVSRPPKIRAGAPFLVEVGLVYGGALPPDQPIQLLRFANRVPLLFQQGACAITSAVETVDWRRYGLDQRGGQGLPTGPCILLVHVASTRVPFTSESKEAVAEDSEIVKELQLALQAIARHLKSHISRQVRREFASEKFTIIRRILPQIAEKASHLTGKPVPDLTPVITEIMNVVTLETTLSEKEAAPGLTVTITNYTPRARVLELFAEMPPELTAALRPVPAPDGTDPALGRAWWTLPKLLPNGRTEIQLRWSKAQECDASDFDWYVAGVDESHLLGADALPGDWEVRLPRQVVEAVEAAEVAGVVQGGTGETEVDYDGAEKAAALEEDD